MVRGEGALVPLSEFPDTSQIPVPLRAVTNFYMYSDPLLITVSDSIPNIFQVLVGCQILCWVLEMAASRTKSLALKTSHSSKQIKKYISGSEKEKSRG